MSDISRAKSPNVKKSKYKAAPSTGSFNSFPLHDKGKLFRVDLGDPPVPQ
jgi:hypothetical protein